MLQIDALVEGDIFGAILEAMTAAVPEPDD